MAVSNVLEKILIKNPNGSIQMEETGEAGLNVGNARGAFSKDFQTSRDASAQVASGPNSSILGGGSNTASGTYSTAFGVDCTASAFAAVAFGRFASAGGFSSTAFGAQSNASAYKSTASGVYTTASANYACVTGYSSTASGAYAISAGNGSLASGASSFCCSTNGTASGQSSFASGSSSIASGDYSTASGQFSLASIYGQAARASGRFSATGDAQISTHILRISTTDGVAKEMFVDGVTTSLTLSSGRFLSFEINLLGVQTSGAASAQFIRKGIIANIAGTTSIIDSVQTVGTDIKSAGAAAWTISVTAENTEDKLLIQVTGEAAKTIRWVAKVSTVEIAI